MFRVNSFIAIILVICWVVFFVWNRTSFQDVSSEIAELAVGFANDGDGCYNNYIFCERLSKCVQFWEPSCDGDPNIPQECHKWLQENPPSKNLSLLWPSLSHPGQHKLLYQMGYTSQTSQDRWAFSNIFVHLFNAGLKGTYVDLAAAWPKSHSNTWFFDRCLGWNGICIEADPQKHQLWRGNERSCVYEPTCVSNTSKRVNFLSYAAGLSQLNSKIVPDTKTTSGHGKVINIPCVSFSSLLIQNNVHHINLLSLDIEGHEFEALSSLDFNQFTIDVLLVETAQSNHNVQPFLKKKGFIRLGNVGFDTAYVHSQSIWNKYCVWSVKTRLSGYNRQDRSPQSSCSFPTSLFLKKTHEYN